jgi:hypothetical protein
MKKRWLGTAVALCAALFVSSVSVRPDPVVGSPRVTIVSEAQAGLLDDPIGHIWNFLKDQVFGKIGALISAPIEQAKQALQNVINQAKQAISNLFMEHVLQPAINWALDKVFPGGAAGFEKVKNAIARVFGAVDGMIDRVAGWADAALAIAERSPQRLQGAQAKFNAVLEKLKNFNLQQLVDILLPLAQEKLTEFVKSKTVELLEKAWSFIEKPIEAGKTAAISAIGSIPIIGGVISGAANAIITTGLAELRKAAFDFISSKAAELAGNALVQLGAWVRKGAAGADAWLQPAYNVFRGLLDQAKPLIEKALAVYQKMKDTFNEVADALKDPSKLGEKIAQKIAGLFEEKVLEPLIAFVRKPIDDAASSVKGALERLKTTFLYTIEEKVVNPAVAWVNEKMLVAKETAERFVSQAFEVLAAPGEKVNELDAAAARALEGFQKNDLILVNQAEAQILQRLQAVSSVTDAQIVDKLIEKAKDQLIETVKSRISETLSAGFSALDEALGGVVAGARKFIEGVPIVGPTLAGLADKLVGEAVTGLGSKALAFLTGPAIDKIKGFIDAAAAAAKGAAAAVAKPAEAIVASLKGLMQQVRVRLSDSKKTVEGLLAKVRAAKQRLFAAVQPATGGR